MEKDAMQKFTKSKHQIEQKESILDGNCKYFRRFGSFSKYMMERFGLIRYAGNTGKTRIVIEYDNDSGEGWMRAVSEDPEGISIQTNQTEK